MYCDHCYVQMDATPSTKDFPDCNTWTCPTCGDVKPEAGSQALRPYQFDDCEFDDYYDDYDSIEDDDWSSASDRDLRFGHFGDNE